MSVSPIDREPQRPPRNPAPLVAVAVIAVVTVLVLSSIDRTPDAAVTPSTVDTSIPSTSTSSTLPVGGAPEVIETRSVEVEPGSTAQVFHDHGIVEWSWIDLPGGGGATPPAVIGDRLTFVLQDRGRTRAATSDDGLAWSVIDLPGPVADMGVSRIVPFGEEGAAMAGWLDHRPTIAINATGRLADPNGWRIVPLDPPIEDDFSEPGLFFSAGPVVVTPLPGEPRLLAVVSVYAFIDWGELLAIGQRDRLVWEGDFVEGLRARVLQRYRGDELVASYLVSVEGTTGSMAIRIDDGQGLSISRTWRTGSIDVSTLADRLLSRDPGNVRGEETVAWAVDLEGATILGDFPQACPEDDGTCPGAAVEGVLIASNDEHVVAVHGSSGEARVHVSKDGASWTAVSELDEVVRLHGLSVMDSGDFLAVGYSLEPFQVAESVVATRLVPSVWVSDTGEQWEQHRLPAAQQGGGDVVAATAGPLWAAVLHECGSAFCRSVLGVAVLSGADGPSDADWQRFVPEEVEGLLVLGAGSIGDTIVFVSETWGNEDSPSIAIWAIRPQGDS